MATDHLILNFVAGPLAGRTVALAVGDTMTFGSAADRDCVLAGDGRVSAQHAQLSSDHTGIWLVDQESEYGTFVNGEKVSRRRVVDEDRVLIGATVFDIQLDSADALGGMLAQAVFGIQGGAMDGQRITIEQGTYILGRSEVAADVWLDDPSVSRRHAVMTIGGGRVTVGDLDTIGGTALDGEPAGTADEPSTVNIGSVVALGDTRLTLESYAMAGTETVMSGKMEIPPQAMGAHGVLAGLIEQVGLGEVLQILATAQRSGSLTMRGPDDEIRVIVSRGRVMGALRPSDDTASSADKMRETLADAATFESGTFHFDPMFAGELDHPLNADVNQLMIQIFATDDDEDAGIDDIDIDFGPVSAD